jgi:hypothetical protein
MKGLHKREVTLRTKNYSEMSEAATIDDSSKRYSWKESRRAIMAGQIY